MEWNSDPMVYPAWLRPRIKRGLGIGVGAEYRPWLRVRDVPSRGTSSQTFSMRFQRVFHFLSELETTYFYLLERDFSILDVREQFPILTLPDTLEICSTLGVKHPQKSGKPEPFTIDFLLTIKTADGIKFVARSIKTPKDAIDPDVRLRLNVEEVWCELNGISWKLVDTSTFDATMLQVLRSMRGWFRNRLTLDTHFADNFAKAFLDIYQTNIPLSRLLEITQRKISIDSADTQDWFNYCAWSKRIPLSLKSISTLADVVVLNQDETN